MISSSTRPTRATFSQGCYEDVAHVGRVGRLSRSVCHALTCLVGRQSAAVCSAARLSVCRAVLQIPRARHAHVVDKSLAYPRSIFVRHVRFPPDMLATSWRGYHGDVTRKLLPWNFIYTRVNERCQCFQRVDYAAQSEERVRARSRRTSV